MSGPRIAYIAGQYPLLSETFVHREVGGLRRRGWDIATASLYVSDQPVEGENHADLLVYPPNRFAGLLAWTGTIIQTPRRTARTFIHALGDALYPREPTALSTRCKFFVQALAGSALGRALRKRGVHHLHCHFAHAPASVGMYAAMHAGIPFSFTGHANDLFQRRALLKRKLQRAAFVACISYWHQKFYESVEPTVSPRCRIVRCGVDLDRWRAAADEPPEESSFRLVTVARLVPKKGIDTLLRALATFTQNFSRSWQLDIYGEGPEKEHLLQLANDVGLTQQVTFHGALPNDQVRDRIANAHLFVLPCRPAPNGDQDGIPVVLMEAMAVGVPVIAGDVTAVRELVDHQRTGIRVTPDEPQALCHWLMSLANDPVQRQELAEAGRHTVEKEFDLNHNLQRLEQAIQASIENRAICEHE
jgi:glycosyltransferase involved in cell wall biosynthesis